MSDAIYPVLAGQAWPRVKVIRTATTVKRANGRRYALSQQLYPTYLIKIAYSFLRKADLDALSGFFRARRGALDDFLFDDRDDRAAEDQIFGIGNGIATQFQLVRQQGGFIEPVYALNGAAVVKKDGTTQTVTISSTGLVTFGTAPAAGAVLTWTGLFYWRCAFTKHEQEFEEFMRLLYVAKQVEFETFHP